MVNADISPGGPVDPEFGPYRLVRRLGVGGMAETFEAIRTGPGGFSQRVCLKLVLPFYRDRADFLELFEREARLAAKLRHGNIVGVLDFGQIDGVTYIALELVDGVDLGTLIDSRPGARLSAEFSALIGHDLAAALEHAHDPGRDGSDGSEGGAIVHRDISPSNVMISRRGEILLTDFGVAKALNQAPRPQSAIKGKVPYMSPEQLRAEPLDGRSDLFALGVILYEALAGQRPYQGDHDPATIMMILQGDRPPLASFAPDAPEGLLELVEQLLAPDRNDRPENAAAVLELLEAFVPPPRMRRELGALAEEVRTHPVNRGRGLRDYGSDAGDTPEPYDQKSGVGPTGNSLASGPEPVVRSFKKTRRATLLFLLALLGVGAAVFAWRGTPTETTPEVASGAAEPTSVAERADAEEVAAPAEGAEAGTANTTVDGEASKRIAAPVDSKSSPATEERAVEARPGRLTVIVFPWGNVWINGGPRGSAPLKNAVLKPGRYRVSAGQGKPTVTKTVRLRPGDRKQVNFDLTK